MKNSFNKVIIYNWYMKNKKIQYFSKILNQTNNYAQLYTKIRNDPNFITTYQPHQFFTTYFKPFIAKLQQQYPPSTYQYKLLNLLIGKSQPYFNQTHYSQIQSLYTLNKYKQIQVFTELQKNDYQKILQHIKQTNDASQFHKLILENLDKIFEDNMDIILDICTYKSDVSLQLGKKLLDRLVKNPQRLYKYYSKLFRIFEQDYKILWPYYIQSLRRKQLKLSSFLKNICYIKLQEEDLNLIQELLKNEQECIEQVSDLILRLHQKNDLYLNDRIVNNILKHIMNDGEMKLINIYIKFMLQYCLTSKYTTYWKSLNQKIIHNPKVFKNQSVIIMVLSKFKIYKTQNDIIHQIITLIWTILDHFNSDSSKQYFYDKLQLFIAYNQNKLLQKNIHILYYDQVTPQNRYQKFPKIRIHQQNHQKQLVNYIPSNTSRQIGQQLVQNINNNKSISNQNLLVTANYLIYKKTFSHLQKETIAKKICENLQSMNIKNLINVKNIYNELKEYLPRNLMQNLKIGVMNRLRLDIINGRIVYELIMGFRLLNFDNLTIVYFEQKLMQDLQKLKLKQIYRLIQSFRRQKKLGYKLLWRIYDYIIHKINELDNQYVQLIIKQLIKQPQLAIKFIQILSAQIQTHQFNPKQKSISLSLILSALDLLNNPFLLPFQSLQLHPTSNCIYQKLLSFLYSSYFHLNQQQSSQLAKYQNLCYNNINFHTLFKTKIHEQPQYLIPYMCLFPEYIDKLDIKNKKRQVNNLKEYFENKWLNSNDRLMMPNIRQKQGSVFLRRYQVQQMSKYLIRFKEINRAFYENSILYNYRNDRQLIFRLLIDRQGWSQRYLQQSFKILRI